MPAMSPGSASQLVDTDSASGAGGFEAESVSIGPG